MKINRILLILAHETLKYTTLKNTQVTNFSSNIEQNPKI